MGKWYSPIGSCTKSYQQPTSLPGKKYIVHIIPLKTSSKSYFPQCIGNELLKWIATCIPLFLYRVFMGRVRDGLFRIHKKLHDLYFEFVRFLPQLMTVTERSETVYIHTIREPEAPPTHLKQPGIIRPYLLPSLTTQQPGTSRLNKRLAIPTASLLFNLQLFI